MNDRIHRYVSPLAMPFSKAVRAGDFLFLSGVLPMDAQGRIVAGDIGVQTRVVLERIAATLGEAGAGMSDVVRVTVWLADLADFAAFNEEYRRHFRRRVSGAVDGRGEALWRGAHRGRGAGAGAGGAGVASGTFATLNGSQHLAFDIIGIILTKLEDHARHRPSQP